MLILGRWSREKFRCFFFASKRLSCGAGVHLYIKPGWRFRHPGFIQVTDRCYLPFTILGSQVTMAGKIMIRAMPTA